MSRPMTDLRLEKMVSVLLRSGVLLSGAVVLAGGLYYLIRHGGQPVNYSVFHGAPAMDRTARGIVKGMLQGRAQSIIQFGILLLVATPIARVVLSLFGFAVERDRTYVFITAIVLSVLILSVFTGAVGG